MKLRRLVAVVPWAVLLSAPIAPPSSREPIEGSWHGAIVVLETELAIEVTFERKESGLEARMSIPQQGASRLPLSAVRFDPPKIHFELVAGPGLAVFDGELRGEQISGSFTQAGIRGSFRLARGAPAPAGPPPPAAALPYREEEVSVRNGEIVLAGTISLPKGAGPHPGVVLLSGSGPQDRNETVAGFEPFRVLADGLARRGLVVLRMDDRGVGRSTGSFASAGLEELVSDALAALVFLGKRPEVDPKRAGLLGHSEGGSVAAVAATRSGDVRFLVLLAAPAVRGEDLLLAQAEAIGRAEGATEPELERQASLERRLFACARTGQGLSELRAEIEKEAIEQLEKLPPEIRKAISNPAEFAAAAAEGQIGVVRSSWFRTFLDFDPAGAIGKVRCPVLALYGEKDLQVPADLNRRALLRALEQEENPRVEVKVLPEANHLFQKAGTGSPSEYPKLDKEFVPGLLELIAGFIERAVPAEPQSPERSR